MRRVLIESREVTEVGAAGRAPMSKGESGGGEPADWAIESRVDQKGTVPFVGTETLW